MAKVNSSLRIVGSPPVAAGTRAPPVLAELRPGKGLLHEADAKRGYLERIRR